MNKNLKILLYLTVIIVGVFFALNLVGRFLINKFAPNTDIVDQDEFKDQKLELGKKIPYFSLLALSGGRKQISDFPKTGSLLVFWSTWNDQSIDQIKILDDYQNHLEVKNNKVPINIIAINSQEDEDRVVNFMHRGGYDLNVLVDPTGETSIQYGVQNLPTSFFIDKDGKLVEIFVGSMSESMLVDKIEKILP